MPIDSRRLISSFCPSNLLTRKDYAGHMGVIGRSNYCANCSPAKQIIGWYKRISFQQITDGSSKTMVLGEKRLSPALYESGDWHDDWSWAEGWDPDTLRSTICLFGPDTDDGNLTKGFGYNFGAAHPSAMNAGFADGSITSIRYDIDRELFNRLGHRSRMEKAARREHSSGWRPATRSIVVGSLRWQPVPAVQKKTEIVATARDVARANTDKSSRDGDDQARARAARRTRIQTSNREAPSEPGETESRLH